MSKIMRVKLKKEKDAFCLFKKILFTAAFACSVFCFDASQGFAENVKTSVQRTKEQEEEAKAKAREEYRQKLHKNYLVSQEIIKALPFTPEQQTIICNKFKKGEYEDVPFKTLEEAGYSKDFFKPFQYLPGDENAFCGDIKSEFAGGCVNSYPGKVVVKVDYDNDGKEETIFKFLKAYWKSRSAIEYFQLGRYTPDLDRKFSGIFTRDGSFGDVPSYLSLTMKGDAKKCAHLDEKKGERSPALFGDVCYYSVSAAPYFKRPYYYIPHDGGGQKFILIDGVNYLATFNIDPDYAREDIPILSRWNGIRDFYKDDNLEEHYSEKRKPKVIWIHQIKRVLDQDMAYLVCDFFSEGD